MNNHNCQLSTVIQHEIDNVTKTNRFKIFYVELNVDARYDTSD